MGKTPCTKNLLLAALLIALLGVLSVDASAAWQDDTILVSKQGRKTGQNYFIFLFFSALATFLVSSDWRRFLFLSCSDYTV